MNAADLGVAFFALNVSNARFYVYRGTAKAWVMSPAIPASVRRFRRNAAISS